MEENNQDDLYSNEYGSVSQCDVTNRISVRFANTTTSFRIDNFLNFKRLVDGVDIQTMIFDLSDVGDFSIIDAPNANHQFKLTLCEIIHLRQLLDGAKFALYVYEFLDGLLCETAS